MHIGQGSRPTTCCKYRPNANIATDPKQMSARTRRGNVVFLAKNMFICSRLFNRGSSSFEGGFVKVANEGAPAKVSFRCLTRRITKQFVKTFARWCTNRLGFTQDLARTHHGAGPVFAAHEARHGRATKGGCCHKRRTRYFRFIAKTIWKDGRFCFRSCHWRYLFSVGA